jgi:UDP-glucose 4-epimerase
MKILITGGAGFIGSHIADACIKDGHEVVIIDNFYTGKHENVNPKAKLYEMDICDPKLSGIFLKEKPDVLSHHAAQIDVRVSVEDPQFDLKVNVGGLINVMEAGRKSGLKKVIFASSGGAVYGEQDIYPAPETHPARPVCPYGLNKLSCERYLHYYEQVYGIKWTALRYGNVYGPRQNPHGEAGVVAVFLNKMLKGGQPVINGDGRQTRDYVYISDVVEANRLALKDDARGPYNVGTGIETDVNTIFSALRELTGGRCEEKHGPAKAGEQQRSSIDASKIKRGLGWSPQVSFAEGMKLTAEWFKKNI